MTLARRTALRPRGARAARWEGWQERNRRDVLFRETMTCEACNYRDRFIQPDVHHLMGRGARVAEPWASSAALTAALCRSCHDAWHDGLMPEETRSALLWAAARRLLDVVRSPSVPMSDVSRGHLMAEETIYALLREAGERGIMPAGWAKEEERTQ